MKIIYHKLMLRIKHRLWYTWHCTLRSYFDRTFYNTNYYGENHAWWMLCCNGNAGGWRTDFCDSLEDYYTGWRYHESVLDELGAFGEPNMYDVEDHSWDVEP